MLTHPTLDQLRALKLDGMVQAFIELEAQEETRNLAQYEVSPKSSTSCSACAHVMPLVFNSSTRFS
jgi:hypothetical protein